MTCCDSVKVITIFLRRASSLRGSAGPPFHETAPLVDADVQAVRCKRDAEVVGFAGVAGPQPDTCASETGMLLSSRHGPREWIGRARGRTGRGDPQRTLHGRSRYNSR